MTRRVHRRRVLATIAVGLLTGCVAGGEGDEPQATPTRGSELDLLPEPSPLASPLPGLVAAEDRAAYAREHDLEYRDGTVMVEVEIVAGGEPPDQYLFTVISEGDRTVVAYVAVEDLVDLALDDSVRIVRPPAEPQTHGG